MAHYNETTLQAIQTDVVNKAVNREETNVVSDDRPPPINNSVKDLTRKGYCRLIGYYNNIIKKDASPNVYADCVKTPHEVKHLFVCPVHSTTLRLQETKISRCKRIKLR